MRPLGQLALNDGFSRHSFLLHLFCRELNLLTGPNVVFLFGGSESISDIDDVAGTLKASLLERVPEEIRGDYRVLSALNSGNDHLSKFFYRESAILEDHVVLDQRAQEAYVPPKSGDEKSWSSQPVEESPVSDSEEDSGVDAAERARESAELNQRIEVQKAANAEGQYVAAAEEQKQDDASKLI